MADIVSRKKRSEMMSGIQSKDTKPEIKIRSALHRLGFRYKLHDKRLPGKPDIVFPKYKAVILVHGCFWHNHGCHIFKWPSSSKEFWEEKILKNVDRDKRNLTELMNKGWRVLTIWECTLKGKFKLDFRETIEAISQWLVSNDPRGEISGKK